MLGAGETVIGSTDLLEADLDARGLYKFVEGGKEYTAPATGGPYSFGLFREIAGDLASRGIDETGKPVNEVTPVVQSEHAHAIACTQVNARGVH